MWTHDLRSHAIKPENVPCPNEVTAPTQCEAVHHARELSVPLSGCLGVNVAADLT